MNVENRLHAPGISLLTIVLMVSLSGVVRVTQASQFTPPDLNGFNMHDEREGDGDGDGVNETVIRQYLNDSGDSIVSMTTKGRCHCWPARASRTAPLARSSVANGPSMRRGFGAATVPDQSSLPSTAT